VPRINPTRILSRIDEMNRIGTLPNGGNRRLSLTIEDKAARDLLMKWMKDEKLEVKVDEMGNMYGIRKGTKAKPGLALGSHLDTVATGGRFDGTYGVLAALEVISVLNEGNIQTERPMILINFTNEEGARFAPDMMGSLVVSKPKLRDEIWKATDLYGTGKTVKDELQRIGYLGDVQCGSTPIDYYLELHIEQGPILEKEGTNIGVVEKVQGIFWTEYILYGQAAHAGTTPLELRRDPGLLASEINLFLRKIAQEIPGQLATIGLMEFHPNAINVVPDHIRLVTDLRNPTDARLTEAQEKADAFIQEKASNAGITVRRSERVRLSAVDFSGEVISEVESAATSMGLSARRMVSGAGHDAQMMAAVSKAAMIFVPSVNGISHNEAELTEPPDLVNGANVLLDTVLRLDRRS